ncbi:PA14 domain-containing protein [Leeuwenhoekiella aequorea]|uniref:PA14 domain-containing protein n=1 Tax=Leeuwenhoekiella aequorea TaxID=283736 RepID=A0A4Q0PBX7_9FLAO|nr:PA14 domain-containing protein [Leeuwenhoekiella aequorea]RXG23856.1 PA14 domain-containing protein [Leeuwenhoekiella aequorea]
MIKKILSFSFFLSFISGWTQVGIGTTMPEASLDIRAANHLGAVSAKDGILIPRVANLNANGSTDGQLIYLIADVAPYSKGFHYWDSGVTGWIPLNSTVEPWYKAETLQPATLNTDNLYTMGQVGIGTSNPLGALHITTENSRDVLFLRFINGLDDDLDLDLLRARGTLASPALLPNDTRIGGLRGQAMTNAAAYTFNPSAEIYFQADGASSSTSSSGKIKFATTPSGSLSTVDRMVIRENGFVGIGTMEPIEHIEIKRDGDNDMQFTSASTNPPNVIFYNTGGTLAAPKLLNVNQEIGSVVFKTHDGNTINEVGGMRMFIDGSPAAGSLPTKIVFNTTRAGSVNQTANPGAMTINNAGNVGIGVADPIAKLDVLGTVKITDGTQGTGKILTSDANGNASWQVPGANSSNWALQGNAIAATDFLGTTNSQPLNFRVNNMSVGSFKVDNSLQLGREASSNAANATAVGFQAKATATSAVAIGTSAIASDGGSIALGSSAKGQKQAAVAIGSSADARRDHSIAIGINTISDGYQSTALGADARTNSVGSTAIGRGAIANGVDAIVLGNTAAYVGIGTSTPDNSTKLHVAGKVKIVDGTQGIGKILSSDANGNASWQLPAVSETRGVQYYSYDIASIASPDLINLKTNTRISKSGDYNGDLIYSSVFNPSTDEDGFVVKITGTYLVKNSGNFIFTQSSDDGARIYIDDVLILNDWVDSSNQSTSSPAILLSAGKHKFDFWYYENAGGQSFSFSWGTNPDGNSGVMKASQFTVE